LKTFDVSFCALSKILELLKRIFAFLSSNILILLCWSRDNLVSIASGYGLDDRGSIPDSGKRLFTFPQHLDRLWGPHSHLSNGYRELSSGGKAARA
jgi:hypothetical protein